MKSLFLLFPLLIGLQALHAQNRPSVRPAKERPAWANRSHKHEPASLQERSAGRVLDSIYCVADFFGDGWKDYTFERFGYENSLHVVDSSQSNFNLTQPLLPTLWLDSDKNVLEYDTEGKLKTKAWYSYSQSQQQFEEFLLTEYSYDSEGKLIQEDYSFFEAGAWTAPQGRTEYIYNPSGQNTNALVYYFDIDFNEWALIGNDTLTYHPDGKLHIDWVRHVEGNEIIDDQRYFHTYDAEGRLSEIFVDYWAEDAWHDSEKDIYYYEAGEQEQSQVVVQLFNEDTGSWVDVTRCDYYYSEPSAVKAEPLNNILDCTVPNPFLAGSTLTCKGVSVDDMELRMTDLLGREVVRQPLATPIASDKLVAGYYLLNVTMEGSPKHFQKLVFVPNP